MAGNRSPIDEVAEFLEYMQLLGYEGVVHKTKRDLLDEIAKQVEQCQRCPLHKLRNRAVPGEGNPEARIMFVGEAPGEEEDKQGRPFVGRAGELLTRMIAAMGFSREQVFIANVLKCRPPHNRDPKPDEVKACLPFLERQIEIIKPEVIITLGNVPMRALLGRDGITKERGKWGNFAGIPVMPTFHPSYLLRHEPAKRFAWEDLKAVLRRLGLPIPSTSKKKR